MQHVIKLMNDEPFKERFRRITPPLVDEVHQHIQEMLDGSTIRPSQLPWCNTMVLVRKKDGSLQFCIDFRRLNALIYLDDVTVYSKTKKEHLVHLRTMLEQFMEHGLKLKPSKYNFFRTKISYLGHKVSVAEWSWALKV